MNYNKSIRYVSKSITACLILLILCTVFVINRDYINPTVTAKYFWFYILIGLLSLWIPVLVKKQRMVFSLLDFLCLLFVAYVSLNSFWAYRECSSKLMLFLLLGILYYYFRIAFTVENRLFTILSIGFIFTGCVEAIWGLGQLYGLLPSFNSSFKITGSFYNPGPYSGYLAIVFPMAFYFLLNDFPKIFGNQGDKNTIVRFRWILSLLAFSLIVVILPAGMSRASWVAVIGGSIVVLFCYIRKEDNQWWRSFKERLSPK